MKSVSSLIMLAVGVIVALAVTIRTPWINLPLAGWSLALGGAAGLLLDVLRHKAGQRPEPWQIWAPRLLAVGAIGWLALQIPAVPYIDLPTVGFILFLVGAGLCAGAAYEFSGWRLGRSMREMWRTPDDAERTKVLPSAYDRDRRHGTDYGDRPGPTYDRDRGNDGDRPRHDEPPTRTLWRP